MRKPPVQSNHGNEWAQDVPAKDDTSSPTLALLLGIGVGAVAALLFAPKTGEELRDDIAGAVGDGIHQLRRQSNVLRQRTQKLVDATTDQVQNVLDERDKAFKKVKKARA